MADIGDSKGAVDEAAAAGAGGLSSDNSETVEKKDPLSSQETNDKSKLESSAASEKESFDSSAGREEPSLKRKFDDENSEEDGDNKRAKVETAAEGDGEEPATKKESAVSEEKEKDDGAAEASLDSASVVEKADKEGDTRESKEAKQEEDKKTADEKKEEWYEKEEEREKKEVKEEEEQKDEKMDELAGSAKTKDTGITDSGDAESAKANDGESKDSARSEAKHDAGASDVVTDKPSSEDTTEPQEEKCRYPIRGKCSDAGKEVDANEVRTEIPAEQEKDSEENVKRESASRSSGSKSYEADVKGQPEKEDAPSVKSDGGSDKENVGSDMPMDLSNSGTPDVIMLSDEDDAVEPQNHKKDIPNARRKVKRLQAELRNEEAKLVLLKKLRQSQLAPQIQEHPPVPSTNSGSNASNQMKANVPRQQGGPPPLVRGGQQVRSSGLHIQQPQQGRSVMQGQSRTMQGPPPLIGAPRTGMNTTNGHSMQNIRGNLGMHGMSQHSTSGHRALQQQQQQQQQQHQQAATPPQPPVDTQTPAQRQAAAKLALRKQLEKTLLQIPPPKPPAPEMNFIPSLACPDFVLLLGLEEVVNHIIDLQLIARGQKSPDEKFICNPFTCVQCGSDYTPVWKREKPGSKNVICEHCVTWNQKRALKQEHTNRLKSAFVKALQQEQEIERMQAQTLASTPPAPSPAVTPPSTIVTAPPQALAAAANSVAAAAAMSLNTGLNYRASAEQVRHHHSYLQQAHQAQLRAGQPLGLQGFGPRSPFYSLPYVKQADLQRQYLLDMIPRAAMPWKP